MRKRYIHPMATLVVIEEESIMTTISNTTTNNGSDNGGSGNSSPETGIGVENGEGDGSDLAAKGFYISWNGEDDF